MSKKKEEIHKNNNINIVNTNFSNDNFILHKSTFNSRVKNSLFNYFEPKLHLTLRNKKYKNVFSNSIKKPSIIINFPNNYNEKRNSSFSRTFGKTQFNYDEIINFNFGSKKQAQLKFINTSALTTNSRESDKNNLSKKIKDEKQKQKQKKTSLFNRKSYMNFNQSKNNIGYPQLKNSENKNVENKKTNNLSERKSITNHNGLLKLPLLSNIISNTKIKYKKSCIRDDDDKDLIIKKYIQKKEYNKINELFDKDNENMNKKIEKKLKSLDEKIKKYYLKRPNEETEEGMEELYKIFNEKRAKKYNIITNRTLNIKNKKDDFINIHTLEEIENYNKNKLNNILIDVKGNQRFLIEIDDEKNKKERKLNDYELISLTNQANSKVEKLFPDLSTFHLPKILRQNKEYTIKLLYDVFIEFKTLLKCGMIHNRTLNMHKKGIDFDTFFNCNTKINQQGIALSRKIFKAFNNKTNLNYMPWQNYMDGMMKIKDPNIDNKLDLFFQILDENGDGSFDYNEVYNLSLISLQRVLPEKPKPENISSKESEKNKDKENEEDPDITNILAEFLTKYVFQLVGIDIDGEIPIDLLREKMDEKSEESEYLEFFLCADNFA